jgi:undecaprenyl diphosphate synthase
MTVVLAVSYGGRQDLVNAARNLAQDIRDGRLSPEEIDEQLFDAYLDTAGIPDPDLLIRTSGETRISNFLLWQAAYAEFVFLEVLWPDFSAEHLRTALDEFSRRQRRFGLVGAQLEPGEGGDH